MDKEKELISLEYKIKLLHMMITNTDDYKFYFYSFVIDHNITEYQTSLILNSLTIIKDKLKNGSISDLSKTMFADKKELSDLINNQTASYKEFESFIHTIINDDINVKYLIKSLKLQKINVEVCDFLLNDMDK